MFFCGKHFQMNSYFLEDRALIPIPVDLGGRKNES